MKFVDLLEGPGIVQIDISKSDEMVRVLANKVGRLGEAFRRDQENPDAIRFLELNEHLLQNTGLPIEMFMHVDQSRRNGLSSSRRCQASQQNFRSALGNCKHFSLLWAHFNIEPPPDESN